MSEHPKTVLGLDLGTSTLKAVLADADGTIRAAATHSYPTAHPEPAWAEQNPADWLAAVRAAIARLRAADPEAFARLACVGLCSAAHIPVLLDADGAVLRPAILWSDQRSEEEVRALDREYGETLARETLNQAGCTWTLPQILWVRRHEPEIFARAVRLLSSKDYLVHVLTGAYVTDPASAAATLIYDVGARRWSPRLEGASGLPEGALPEVIAPLARAGAVTSAAAAAFGLPAGLPVIAGTLDSAAELVGCGILTPSGTGMVMVGSSGGIMGVTAHASSDPGILTYPYVVEGLYTKQAGTNACAISLSWLGSVLSSVPGCTELGHDDLDRMAAQSPPGARGLIFHPYLQGERTPYWNPDLRGSFTGLDRTHRAPDFVRAVMEGVALSLRDCLAAFASNGVPIRRAVMAGGVARSPVWSRIITDTLGIETFTTGSGESAFGAALLAMTACGLFPDLASAATACVREERTLRPDPALADLYGRAFRRYRTLAGVFDTLSKTG